MDVQKVFYTVWHNGLRAQLLEFQLPLTVLKWVYEFIDGHTAQIRVKGVLSPPPSPTCWCPSGGRQQPSTLLHPVCPRHPRRVQTLPTDTVFWVSSTQTRHLVRNLTQIFTGYLVYCNEWRIKLNTAKTQLCYIITGGTGTYRL